ncbi:MAG: HAMP domain-containing protein, partial [Zoogloea sp.]|nr:HAMP domain-containing protein [Zoogloea sp.]
MKLHDWDIRARVNFVAVLPTLVLALLLLGYFTSTRLADLEAAHTQRGQALARQIAAASQYGVFAGNRETLQKLASLSLQENGVKGVAIIAASGEVLAMSGSFSCGPPDGRTSRCLVRDHALLFNEPIENIPVQIDDPYAGELLPSSAYPEPQGRIWLEVSRTALHVEKNRLWQTSGLILLGVLVASVLLAQAMSRGLTVPISRVANAVRRFGQGDLTARVPVEGGGSLRVLAEGVNEMADRLLDSREELERRVAEATRQLVERKEEAERANLSKSRFLAAASHDLRQPMHALGLFVAELAQKRHAPETRRLVEQITRASEAMEDLLHSLLDISRLEAGVLVPQVSAFPLQPLLDRLSANYRREANECDVRLRIRPTPLWVESDPLLLERIIANLLSNALLYSPRGTVLVATRLRGGRVRVEVRDSGIGIPRESQEAVFQEFVQLDNPERSRYKGLGLGLAIVRGLVVLLGHRLRLRSEPGRGSVFAVELQRGQPGELPSAESLEPASRLAGLRVALVDDDPLALSALTSLLESWGCEVFPAEG